MAGNGTDAIAKSILASITGDLDFTIPDLNISGPNYSLSDVTALTSPVSKLTNASLTTGTVDGNGTFDVIMRGFAAHLSVEFEKGRLTGAEYSKVYVAAMGAAIQGAVQYLLGKDAAEVAALNGKIAALTAHVNLEAAKQAATLQRINAHIARAQYGVTTAQLANEDAKYGAALFQNTELLPIQKTLAQEQVNTQRAQTMDTRTDGGSVMGMLGKQKGLYAQQIISYQRDSEYKIGKLFVDAWVTNRTVDHENVPTPDAFSVARMSSLLETLRTNNGVA